MDVYLALCNTLYYVVIYACCIWYYLYYECRREAEILNLQFFSKTAATCGCQTELSEFYIMYCTYISCCVRFRLIIYIGRVLLGKRKSIVWFTTLFSFCYTSFLVSYVLCITYEFQQRGEACNMYNAYTMHYIYRYGIIQIL